jgi:steroid delta-isomerase-like uncharacterized protein
MRPFTRSLATLALGTILALPAGLYAREGATEANKEVVRRFNEEVFNKGDVAAIDKYITADAVDHNPPPGTQGDREGFKKWLTAFRAAFPDLKVTLAEVIAEGDLVVFRNTMTGTQKGEYMGMPASGKPISVEAIDIVRFKDGKMVEHWGQMDAMGMMQQLGAMQSPK